MKSRDVIMRSGVLVCAVVGLMAVGWLTGGCVYPVGVNDAALRTRIERTRLCMGVPARITVEFPQGGEEAAETAIGRAFGLLAALDSALSDYQIDSELNRVNAAAGGAAVEVSEPLAAVLDAGANVSQASGGAFDATIGPASRLWRRARDTGALPSDGELAEVRRLVDWRAVELNVVGRRARLSSPGMRLDLGAIGKGFAADRAVKQLRDDGYPIAMVALAGDIVVGDAPRWTKGWTIEVSPTDDRGLGRTLELANAAISTSGDTEQFVQIGGTRYSHIVDPRTGLGTPGGVMVSVVAPCGEWADALSTAAVVMLSRGQPESDVAAMLEEFPGTRALVERRGVDGRPVRSEIGGK